MARSGAFFSRVWFSFCWGLGQEGLDALAVGFQESTEFFGRWESDEVAGDEEFVVDPGGGKLDGGTLTITAQDDADGRGVAIVHAVGFPPVEVEIHLSGIDAFERSDFQIDEAVATESAGSSMRMSSWNWLHESRSSCTGSKGVGNSRVTDP